jgi:ATP-dependent protease HslVU (ClpYQ) peptidase subunit
VTTICCNREEMAADSMVCAGDSIVDTGRKIRRIGDALVGCAGRVSDMIEFCEWLESGKGRDESLELADDFAALMLRREGIYVFDGACIPMPIENEVAAIGGGRGAALGAMCAGATPEQAVCIACALHTSSGPPIVVERL